MVQMHEMKKKIVIQQSLTITYFYVSNERVI